MLICTDQAKFYACKADNCIVRLEHKVFPFVRRPDRGVRKTRFRHRNGSLEGSYLVGIYQWVGLVTDLVGTSPR